MNMDEGIAKRVKLASRIVIQRTRLSPRDLVNLKNHKSYGPIPSREEICELEIGDQLIAQGSIVKKRGEYYFRVHELLCKTGN
jgi:hypothetical protein